MNNFIFDLNWINKNIYENIINKVFNEKRRVVPKGSTIEVLPFEIQIKDVVFIKLYKEVAEKY